MADNKTNNNEEQKPKKNLPIKTIVVILLVLLLEGGTIVTVKMMSKPKAAEASDPIEQNVQAKNRDIEEIPVIEEMSVDNWTLNRARILVNFHVVATARKEKGEELKQLIKDNSTQIKDRVRTLIGSAQPEQIKDPHLQVIKREIKTTIDGIVGEGLVEEILFPVWSSFIMD